MKKILIILIILLVAIAIYAGYVSYLHFGQPKVYISAYGDCYHIDPHCSNMGNTIAITREEAEHIYMKPCEICIDNN